MKPCILLALALAIGCTPAETAAPPPQPAVAAPAADYEKQIRDWQANRAKRLQTEDGWLTVVGLTWLREGDNSLPSMGTLTLKNGVATLKPGSAALTIDGKPVTAPVALKADADEGGPTNVKSGSKLFYVIKRGERYGVRVKDSESEARKNFKGLEYYPIDPKWRVEAKLEPYTPAKQIPIDDITGMRSNNPSPGALVFTVDGKTYRLDPLLEGKDDLFIIFKDETSRDATYPAGRYMYAKMPGPDGKVLVDFNKAYNPPCAFTDFATCPLPPQQNRMEVRVEAGEKKYKH